MYKNYEDKLNTILSNAKGERVELGIIDKLKDAKKFYKVALDMAMDVNDELENLVSMMNATKAAASKAEDSLKVMEKIEKSAKDLGLNANEIPEYKEAKNFEKYVVNIQKTITKNIGKIKGSKL